MKKRLLALSALVLASSGVFGQQDAAVTHFIYNKMTFNPGATGIDEGICGTLTYRNQWDKVNGAPNTALFNVEANLQSFFPGGVGLAFAHDAIGFNRQNNLLLNYSFPVIVPGAGTLGIGVGLGMINLGLSPTWVPPTTLDDPSLPVSTSATTFDVNAGLYWKGEQDYYIGLSSTHLAAPSLEQATADAASSGVQYNAARHYYVMGGKSFPAGQMGVVDVQAMMRTDMVKYSADINARYIFNQMLYGGLTYRTSDAVSVMVGFMPKQMRGAVIGYSYDLTINQLSNVSRGTHELVVKYCYYLPPPPIQKSKHPRWL